MKNAMDSQASADAAAKQAKMTVEERRQYNRDHTTPDVHAWIDLAKKKFGKGAKVTGLLLTTGEKVGEWDD